MNLHDFLADLQRGTAEQYRQEAAQRTQDNLQRFIARQAAPVPSIEEQERVRERPA